MRTLPLDRARWPVLALAASAAMLAAAHGFEFFGYAPCQMCHWQRWVYWVAGSISLLGILAAWRNVNPRMLLALNILLGLTFLTGLGIAFYHAGVEWKVFPGPASCAAGKLDLGGQKLSDLINKPLHVPSCGDAAWRFPAADWGISMAGLNAIISLGLVTLTYISARRAGSAASRNDTANETSLTTEASQEATASGRRSA
jgi:disulfide bond formation protein DsbB